MNSKVKVCLNRRDMENVLFATQLLISLAIRYNLSFSDIISPTIGELEQSHKRLMRILKFELDDHHMDLFTILLSKIDDNVSNIALKDSTTG